MGAPLNYFVNGHGPAATPVVTLDWVFTGICGAVCMIVGALLLAALFRQRKPDLSGKMDEDGGERAVTAGTALSVAVLFGMTIYMLVVLDGIAAPPRTPQVALTVTAYQWWWKVVYDNAGSPVVTANEIHIPVGAPVSIALKSADVVHSFWVPQLGGKTQMIPGLTNRQWLQADAPGIYRGQCTQYCGDQHAHMAFEVVAQSEEDFQKWLDGQKKAASNTAPAGEKVFADRCAACHTVRGTAAKGSFGPDLTHLISRRQIAAGLMDNTPANLSNWVRNAQLLKPEARMPDIDLTPKETSDLMTYLEALK